MWPIFISAQRIDCTCGIIHKRLPDDEPRHSLHRRARIGIGADRAGRGAAAVRRDATDARNRKGATAVLQDVE